MSNHKEPYSVRVLRHRKLIVSVWILLAVVGAWAASSINDHLSQSFDAPGRPAFEANKEIVKTYGNGGADLAVRPRRRAEGRHALRRRQRGGLHQGGEGSRRRRAGLAPRRSRRRRAGEGLRVQGRRGRLRLRLSATGPGSAGKERRRAQRRAEGGRAALDRRHAPARDRRRGPERRLRRRRRGPPLRDPDRRAGSADRAGPRVRLVARDRAADHRRRLDPDHLRDAPAARRNHPGLLRRPVPRRPDRARRGDRLLAPRRLPLARATGQAARPARRPWSRR